MDLDIVILGKISHTEKDKYNISLICGILKNRVQMNLFAKHKQRTRCRKQTWLPGDKRRGEINWEIWGDIHTVLHIKQITSKDLLYSTSNSTKTSAMLQMGK